MRREADSKEEEEKEKEGGGGGGGEGEGEGEKAEVKEEKKFQVDSTHYCQTYMQQDNCLCYRNINIAQCHTAHVKSDM